VKVSDLIKALQCFSPELEVYVNVERGQSPLNLDEIKLALADEVPANARSRGLLGKPERVVIDVEGDL
jgi:hypothetical protein